MFTSQAFSIQGFAGPSDPHCCVVENRYGFAPIPWLLRRPQAEKGLPQAAPRVGTVADVHCTPSIEQFPSQRP